MIFRTRRCCQLTVKSANDLKTFPLTLLSWNIDQERPNTNTRIEKTKRMDKLVECIESIPQVDFVTFQESSKYVPQMMTRSNAFTWLGDAQARTYNGYLQCFFKKKGLWSARISWQYTGLTFEVWPTPLQALVGEDPWKIDGSARQPIKSPIVRISNVHFDSATINHEIRSNAIRYYTKVPQSDIIIGDGQYRSEDVFPSNYIDAYEMTGKSASTRYTLDTYENQYFTHQSANYSRSTRAYVRRDVAETPLSNEKEKKAPLDRLDSTDQRIRPAYKIHATEMKVLKPWISENQPRVSVSDHYGLMVRFLIEI